MKRFAALGLSAALMLLFVGCATNKPMMNYELSPEVDIRPFETFALMPLPKRVSGGRPGALARHGEAAQAGMREALIAKGYTEAATLEEADFAINIKAAITPKLDVSQWGYTTGRYAGTGYWGGSSYYEVVADVDIKANDQRLVILEIYENKGKELAWCAWSIDGTNKKELTTEELKALLSAMVISFPANQ